MADGAGEQFLRAAEQGRSGHTATAFAAAAAMNAAKSRGGGGDQPMKIPIAGAPLNANSAVFDPTDAGHSAGGPQADIMQDQMAAAQMAIAQAQMAQMAQMYNPMMMQGMGPMGMPGMSSMGMAPPMMASPYGWPMMDPSMMGMMGGKGMPGMGYGMGMPKSPVGASGKGKGGKGGKGGDGKGKGKDKEAGNKKKTKAKTSRAEAEDAPDDPNIVRSAVLTEVRKHSGKCKVPFAEVMPHILEFAKDQHGSRFLQTLLEESDEPQKAEILAALLPHVPVLAGDAFGNFVVQKLFDSITKVEDKQAIAKKFQGIVLQLANESNGCRVIQKALSALPSATQIEMASELKSHVDTCIESLHGNHVIQKCIEMMPPESIAFIIDAVSDKVEFWASHMYGCRAIQRLLEHCNSAQMPKLLDQILVSAKMISMDPYGNYVVQHMLDHGRKEDKAKIIGIVSKNIEEFARNKCSSNVVEKCFEIAAIGEHATELVQERSELYSSVLEGAPPPLIGMFDDRFGNYIVQRMIEYSNGAERQKLQQKLHFYDATLKNSPNGKHILAAAQKEFQQGQ